MNNTIWRHETGVNEMKMGNVNSSTTISHDGELSCSSAESSSSLLPRMSASLAKSVARKRAGQFELGCESDGVLRDLRGGRFAWEKLVAGSGEDLKPTAGTGAGSVLSDFAGSKIGSDIPDGPPGGRANPTLSDDKLESW